MGTGDISPRDEFDHFLESAATDGAARQEFHHRLLELTPTVNDTLRELGIPLLQDASDEEVNGNLALLLAEIFQKEKEVRSAEDAMLFAKLRVNGLVTHQAITLLDIKSLIVEAIDNPLRAHAMKQTALARRLYNQEFVIGDAWFQAYDLLIPGGSFDINSDDAQAGYLQAEEDARRRQESHEARAAFTEDLTMLVFSATEDVTVSNRVITGISAHLLAYKLYPANSESAIDEILREANLQKLKPSVMLLIDDFINPPSL